MGLIQVESDSERGTRFKIYLPNEMPGANYDSAIGSHADAALQRPVSVPAHGT